MAWLRHNWLRLAAHLGGLAPLALMLYDIATGHLTANPIQDLTFRTGMAGLILLVVSLACTPANIVLGLKQVLPLRRPLGLYGFLYIAIHLLIFVGLDYGFDWSLIQDAIVEKRYVLVGFAAFLLLLPLAITSTRWSMRRLGKNWKKLHQLIYIAVPLGVLHFLWLVKADYRQPLLFGAIVAVLLVLRIPVVKKQIQAVRYRIAPLKKAARTVAPPSPRPTE